jgi:hypothetical protein
MKDAEFVSETVVINRLYHRELITRMSEIEELEKKWNCKIDFPSTEMASDVVTISGPEYQVPQAVDEFLVLAFCPHLRIDTDSVRVWCLRATRSSSLRPLS